MRNLLFICLVAMFYSCSESPLFEVMKSGSTGINFKNTITETDSFHVMSYEYIYNGAGVGVCDLNNDGLQDLIFAGNQVQTKVYLNLGNFKFKDITSDFKGLTNDQWYSSVSIVDINCDGWPDVYLTSTANKDPKKCKNRLWINNGVKDGKGPTFTEMAEKYGIAEEGQSVNATFFDYDNDGDLDLYVLNNTVTQRMNTSYRVKVTDGSAANNDRLYRNNGDGTFTDVTKEAGIVYEGFGLGLAICDVNKDGYPDIYVSNDYISNDLLYINQRDGTFKNEIGKYLSYQSKSSMGNDIADINNDGLPDICTLDMLPERYDKKKQTINGFSYMFYVNDAKYGYEHQYLRNMLHLHNGFLNGEMIPYSEVGQMAGIYQTDWSWSALFADYNNDGNKDLIITNGYPKDMTDKDWTRMKAQVYGFVGDEKYVISLAPGVKIPNVAFENQGNLNFINKTKEWLPNIPSYSYGAAFVDLDNDGDLDYVTNNINDEAFILKNNTMERSKGNAGYLKIKLTGSGKNTMAIGAKVELWSNGKFQYTEHYMTRGYASYVEPTVHFGLGQGVASVDSVKITWPVTGNTSVVRNIKSNQLIELKEADSTPAVRKDAVSKPSPLLFTRRDGLVNYEHNQKDFVDFFLNQNIIPHKFSQIGPVMVKGDLNNDGKEDLLIGSTNTLPTTVLQRSGSGFKEVKMEGLTTQKEFSEGDLAIVDVDKDGFNDVIAVAGGYENREESEYKHYLYKNNKGSFTRIPLPIPAFPASVVRPCDFNHDGFVDFFVGARVKKGMYPYANHSWLINNQKGTLTVDAASKLDLGMVADAIWSDYDNDGWEDLIVMREWNSIVVFKNMNGKELVPQKLPGIENYRGIWNSIIAGDFNQDGYTDYIVGNLGDNHRFTVGEKYPLSLYAIDLDLDGNLDPVSTGYWKDKDGVMQEYPINYLDELIAQTKFFQKKFADYKSFSYLTIHDMMDAETMKRVDFKLQVNTTSSYILWNEKGTFRWEKLPKELQVSPIKKMIVKDLNGDKYPDVIVSGNDYTYDVATGYYDANKGFVLLSNGKNSSFTVLPPTKSGFLVQGMVGSLNLMEGDTTLVVAGINRAKTAVFQLNKP